VLADFNLIWRLENGLQIEFLKWTLEMLLIVCCYQTSMSLLASGILVQAFEARRRNGM
jgi:hypothetical protein